MRSGASAAVQSADKFAHSKELTLRQASTSQFPVVHRVLRLPDDLVVLVPLACDHHDVAGLGDLHRVRDRLAPVDDNGGTGGPPVSVRGGSPRDVRPIDLTFDPRCNLFNDSDWVFSARVIAGDNGDVA